MWIVTLGYIELPWSRSEERQNSSFICIAVFLEVLTGGAQCV
jgi:hypothetical protein